VTGGATVRCQAAPTSTSAAWAPTSSKRSKSGCSCDVKAVIAMLPRGLATTFRH
jgi:hypothetical protein